MIQSVWQWGFSVLQLLLNMNFSSRTTSLDVQRNLEANVEKRTKDTYGPPPGKRLIIFVDDMNMPQVKTVLVKEAIEETKNREPWTGWFPVLASIQI